MLGVGGVGGCMWVDLSLVCSLQVVCLVAVSHAVEVGLKFDLGLMVVFCFVWAVHNNHEICVVRPVSH